MRALCCYFFCQTDSVPLTCTRSVPRFSRLACVFVGWVQAGAFSFHYVVVDTPSSTSAAKICFLTLAEKGCPRRLAFDYLDDLQKEFIQLHGQQIDNVERPYKFITFDTFIQKTKKLYSDTRANRNHIKMMSDDLRDIQGIMTKNIQDVLGRGEKLETVTNRSSQLSAETRKFKDKATSLYRELLLRQVSWAVLAHCMPCSLQSRASSLGFRVLSAGLRAQGVGFSNDMPGGLPPSMLASSCRQSSACVCMEALSSPRMYPCTSRAPLSA